MDITKKSKLLLSLYGVPTNMAICWEC